MTTIAWRDGVIAADSVVLHEGARIDGRIKVIRRDDGAFIGGSGDCGFTDAFRRWAMAGEHEASPKMEPNCTGFVIMPNGLVRVWDSPAGGYEIRPPYYATGSGSQFALGAMFAGAGAETAVRAALKHDGNSGGDVLVLRCDGAVP